MHFIYFDTILDFNWDCLLEAALDKLGRPYSYHRGDDCIKIYKMHGSVNWRVDLPTNGYSLDWQSQDMIHGLDHEIYCTRQLNQLSTWEQIGPLEEVEPHLILPGYGKAYDIRRVPFLWYRPGFAFSFNHDIYIVGLSLTQDDFFIRSYFLDILPYIETVTGVPGRKITIINPDSNVRQNYDFILSNDNTEFLCEKFSLDHVHLMKNALSTKDQTK